MVNLNLRKNKGSTLDLSVWALFVHYQAMKLYDVTFFGRRPKKLKTTWYPWLNDASSYPCVGFSICFSFFCGWSLILIILSQCSLHSCLSSQVPGGSRASTASVNTQPARTSPPSWPSDVHLNRWTHTRGPTIWRLSQSESLLLTDECHLHWGPEPSVVEYPSPEHQSSVCSSKVLASGPLPSFP